MFLSFSVTVEFILFVRVDYWPSPWSQTKCQWLLQLFTRYQIPLQEYEVHFCYQLVVNTRAFLTCSLTCALWTTNIYFYYVTIWSDIPKWKYTTFVFSFTQHTTVSVQQGSWLSVLHNQWLISHICLSFCDKTNVLESKALQELPILTVGIYYACLMQTCTICYPVGEQEQSPRRISAEVRV